MAAATPAIGLAHVTVVPTNYTPAGDDEDEDTAPRDRKLKGT